MYPSVPQLLVTALAAQFPGVRVVTELPANLEQVLPVVQVNRFSGDGDVQITLDRAYVDLDVWAASLLEADLLASQVATWLRLYLPGVTATGPTGTGTFASARPQGGMVQRPSGNPDVYRVGGAWTITVQAA